MCYCMTFPDTVEEFMEDYKVTDTEHVYSNGTEFVPIYRMKQWFQHEPQIVRCKDCKHYVDVNSRDPAINARYNYCTHQHCIYPKRDDFCSYGERKDT